MKDTDFLYAAGRIRVLELSLLSKADTERLISAKTYDEAAAMLKSKGYDINDSNFAPALVEKKNAAWKNILEFLPDISLLDSLIIKNDFHNLKACIKASVKGIDAKSMLITPSVYSPDAIYNAINQRALTDLPECMKDVAIKAIDLLERASNPQLSDAVCDKAAMEEMRRLVKKTKSDILIDIAETFAETANIKTAYRCINAKKDKEFMLYAICDCREFAASKIVDSALSGTDDFMSFLESTKYSDLAPALKADSTEFEKLCDDKLINAAAMGKYTMFGIAPIIGYYLAVNAELTTLRIILSGKLNNTESNIISKRVRELYV